MAEADLEEGEEVIGVVFEVVGSVGDEAFQDVEASEDGVEVGVLQEAPDASLEGGPGVVLLGDDASSDLSNCVSDVFLHAEVSLSIDGNKEIGFDLLLDLGGEVAPEVGIGGGAEIRQAESELRGREVSALDGSIACICLDCTFEYFKIGEHEFIGFFAAQFLKDGLSLLAKRGVLGLQYV